MNEALSHFIFDHSRQKRTKILVLLALAYLAPENNQECSTSLEDFAQLVRLSPDKAKRILRELEKAGEISITPCQQNPNLNTYRIL